MLALEIQMLGLEMLALKIQTLLSEQTKKDLPIKEGLFSKC